MTVTTTNTVAGYSGDGSTTAFPITFQFFASTDITMQILDAANTNVTSSYSVTYTGGTDSDGLPATGTGIVSPAPASGTTVTFTRSTSKLQSTKYAEGTSFPAKTVEGLADRVTLLVQEAEYNASLVSFNYRGDWASSTTYSVGDAVTNNGSTYICLAAHTASATDEPGGGANTATYWNLFAQAGGEAFNWSGAWAASTAYTVDDAVFNDGSSYICTALHTSDGTNEPGTGASWTNYWDLFAQQGGAGAGTGDLLAANNLADVANAATARANLGLAIGSDVQAFGDILNDLNTLGANSADGEIIVGTGAGALAWESGATLRTSIGVGTGNTPQFAGVEVGHASDTTLARASAGVVTVEGNHVPSPASQAQGDVLYHNGTTWARLAKGTADQVLSMNTGATAPEWADAAGGAMEFLGTVSASNDASVAFTGLSSTYFMYMLVLDAVVPSTDDADLQLRTSTDNGSSYDSGSSDYAYAYHGYHNGEGFNSVTSTSAIVFFEGAGSDTNEQLSGTIQIFNPSAAHYTDVIAHLNIHRNNGYTSIYHSSGRRLSAADVDAIQLFFHTGNIESGIIKLYGLKAS